jgi:hypothetical protein
VIQTYSLLATPFFSFLSCNKSRENFGALRDRFAAEQKSHSRAEERGRGPPWRNPPHTHHELRQELRRVDEEKISAFWWRVLVACYR